MCLALLCPNAQIFSAESSVFLKLLNIGKGCHLFFSADSLSPGCQLAKFWAALSDEKTDSLFNVCCLDRAPIARRISDSLYRSWNEEWASSIKGSATRLFFWRSALHQLFLNFAQAWAYIYSFLATVPLTATKKVLASLKPRPVYVAMQLSRQNTFFFNVLVSARNDSQPLWSLWIACPALSAGLLRFRLFSFTPLSGTLW